LSDHLAAQFAKQAAATCANCAHVSIYGNCGEPERAGLSKTFMLVSHPEGGKDCAAYAAKPSPPDPEIEPLIQAIAEHYGFEQEDMAEMREFASRHRSYALEEFSRWTHRLWALKP